MSIHLRIGRAAATVALLVHLSAYSQSMIPDTVSTDTFTRTNLLHEVVVSGMSQPGKNRPGRMTVSGAEINHSPVLFGEHDVVKTLQTQSGVVSGTEGFAGLYVRGGETDQNLYLLDGLPLLNVYHFGGLFSAFSTYAVDHVDFFKGALPTLFDERVSSIVDISLNQPDYHHRNGIASVGLISGQLYYSIR